MSTIDRLRELQSSRSHGPGVALSCRNWGSPLDADADLIVTVRKALPHLLAVAEAAQKFRLACDAGAVQPDRRALYSALDALDEMP